MNGLFDSHGYRSMASGLTSHVSRLTFHLSRLTAHLINFAKTFFKEENGIHVQRYREGCKRILETA